MNKSILLASILAAVSLSASAISVAHVSAVHVSPAHVVAAHPVAHVATVETHVAAPAVRVAEAPAPKAEAKAYVKPSTVVTPMKPIALSHTARTNHSRPAASAASK